MKRLILPLHIIILLLAISCEKPQIPSGINRTDGGTVTDLSRVVAARSALAVRTAADGGIQRLAESVAGRLVGVGVDVFQGCL